MEDIVECDWCGAEEEAEFAVQVDGEWMCSHCYARYGDLQTDDTEEVVDEFEGLSIVGLEEDG